MISLFLIIGIFIVLQVFMSAWAAVLAARLVGSSRASFGVGVLTVCIIFGAILSLRSWGPLWLR